MDGRDVGAVTQSLSNQAEEGQFTPERAKAIYVEAELKYPLVLDLLPGRKPYLAKSPAAEISLQNPALTMGDL